jgi:hypothetical protein
MDFYIFSTDEKNAICHSLKYWIDHWDFECPTLFGIERQEVVNVFHSFPNILVGTEQAVALATLGALRELLHGASSIPKADVIAFIGINHEQAGILCEKIHQLAKPYL